MDNTKNKENAGVGTRRSKRIASRKLQSNYPPSEAEVVADVKSKPLTDNKNKSKVSILTDIHAKEGGNNSKRMTSVENRNKNVTDQKKNKQSRTKTNINNKPDETSQVQLIGGISNNIENTRNMGADSDNIESSLESMSISNDDENGTTAKVASSKQGNPTPKAGDNMANVHQNFKEDVDISQVVTPTTVFKIREGIRTPMSGGHRTPKRVSLTPKLHNFLPKVLDPIVQRIESPKPTTTGQKQKGQSHVPKSAMYFHQLVEKEESRFKVSCEKWNKVLEEDKNVPEEAHGNILAAIGQALLFQNKRFKQFKELIELHKDESAEKAAYASDLHGFWEMIYYQVEDVHKRFAEIELLKCNNWENKQVQVISKPKPVKKAVVSKVEQGPKCKKPMVSSKFKMFREQMKAKKLAEQQNGDVIFH